MLSIEYYSFLPSLHCLSDYCSQSLRSVMAIKEDLEEEVKQEGGGQDELEALDALEKEAAEYNKACPQSQPPMTFSC